MTDLEELKVMLSVGDLARYVENDALLEMALAYAVSEINHRRGFTGEGYENRYHQNVIEGAIWRLGRIGAEGYSSTAERGITVTWKDVPEWLSSVVPLLKTVGI